MDLEAFVANKHLLERLSREYELLKSSGAEVDYAAWVRQRLREAAADLAASSAATDEGAMASRDSDGVEVWEAHREGGSAAGVEPAGGGEPSTQPPNEHPDAGVDAATQPGALQAPQLSFSRRPNSSQPQRIYQTTAAAARPETAWFLRGEGASPALASAIWGPSALDAAAAPKAKDPNRKQRRVVVVSPQRSPQRSQSVPHVPPAAQPRARAASASRGRGPAMAAGPPVSKLYTKVEPGLFSARPDAYVHPEARPHRTPLAARRPDWVNAASLQAAIKGAASAVPHLQAAAERERRLALSAAVARATLASGLDPDEARAQALYGVAPAAAASRQLQVAQYDHVLRVAQQLAAQNEQLARAVEDNSARVQQQQALLQAALQDRAAGRGVTGAERAEAGPGSAALVAARAHSPPPYAPTTAKERDRTARKEALKALLKQVLGGKGGRRGASGTADAEKLIAGILGLAKLKGGGKQGKLDRLEQLRLLMQQGQAGEEAGGKEGGTGGGGGAGSRAASRAASAGRARSLSGEMPDAAEAAAGGTEQAAAGSQAPSRHASARSRGSRRSMGLPGDEGAEGEDLPAGQEQAAFVGQGAAAGGSSGLGAPGGPGAGGAGHVPVGAGALVESIEDQVAQIVQRDAKAFEEMERLHKVDLLERRLSAMVDQVESKLSRVLQPLSLNAQQQQAAGAGDAASGGKLGAGGAGGAGGAAGGAGVAVVSPRSAGLSVLELQRMLIHINRMESKEQEVRRKWFHDPCQPCRGNTAQPMVVRDGVLGTLDPADPSTSHTRPRDHHHPSPRPHPHAAAAARPGAPHSARRLPCAPTAWHFPPAPPTEALLEAAAVAAAAGHGAAAASRAAFPHTSRLPPSAQATVDAGSSQHSDAAPVGAAARRALYDRADAAARGGGAGGGGGGSSVAAHDGTADAQLDDVFGDPVSDGVLESVLRGRRRFLRAQQLADGDLVASASPAINPVQIMEDVTDFLLDEILREQARDLLRLCDDLGEHMYAAELSGEAPASVAPPRGPQLTDPLGRPMAAAGAGVGTHR